MPPTIAKCVDCHRPIVIACPVESKREWHDRCLPCAIEEDPSLMEMLEQIFGKEGAEAGLYLINLCIDRAAEDAEN